MTVVLQVGNRQITASEIMPLLAGYRMLPQLLQEVLVDEAIAQWEQSLTEPAFTDEEINNVRNQFLAQNQINNEETYQAWLVRHGITPQQFEALAVRNLRIEKFKEATWNPKLESYFLNRKASLDRVIYSLIRTQDVGIAQELYFRIQEGEQSFAELARSFSQGPESQTDGLIGPVELSVPHPTLAQMLSVSQPGQLWPPTRIGEWMVIVRLERFIPAQMDDNMRQRLLNELFTTWIDEQLGHLTASLAAQSSRPQEAPSALSDA